MKDIKRTLLRLEPGRIVQYKDIDYVVHSLVDTEFIMLTSLSGKQIKAKISELSSHTSSTTAKALPYLIAIEDKDWKEAQKRFEVIRPLLGTDSKRTRKEVEKHAKENNVSPASIYRWIESFELHGVVSALVRSRRSDRGATRLDPTVETIIHESIERYFLNKQRLSIKAVIREISEQCKEQGLEAPHGNTIRNRINQVPVAIREKRRRGKDASLPYTPVKGKFPGANKPLAVVQIDHTKLDIILVDDETRQPTGRPYITLAIDVYSRMVTGFYLSFDPPSIFTTGMCITHSVLPKDQWLIEHDLAGPWNVSGVMSIIHVDNALEFRSPSFEKSCHEYGIDLQWRPVKQPQYGAHVERFFKTINSELHNLPGTTFSNIQERKGYDSDKASSLTIREFEKWLTTFIVDVYHQRFHSELEMSPIAKYEKGILGDGETLGSGLPSQVLDPDRFRLDFMPLIERAIKPTGVVFERLHYYSDILRPWINAKVEGISKSTRKFVFRFDPRNMSCLYFYDPELKEYFRIPFRDTTRPPISLWEIRQVRKQVKESGLEYIDEESIFNAYRKMKDVVENSQGKTRATRRSERLSKERKKDNLNQLSRISKSQTKAANRDALNRDEDEINFEEILPFDDVKE